MPLKRFHSTPTRPLGTVMIMYGHSTTVASIAASSRTETPGRWRMR